MVKPIYIFSGFLDSGKTRAIKETLLDSRFNEGEKTLVITFVLGVEEYDEAFQKASNTVVEVLSFKEWDLTKQKELEDKHHPDRIFIEFNGLEDDNKLYALGFIAEWEIAQTLTTVDASTFRLYIANMRQFMFNHIVNAEVAILNRSDNEDLRFLRNNLKSINQSLEIIFEDENGNVTNKLKDSLFDVSKPLVIEDLDYGLWYMDALDLPYKYDNVDLTINAFLYEIVKEYPGLGIFGRKAMVCCADDMQPIAFSVIYEDVDKLAADHYYQLHGKICVMDDENGNPTCVLKADKVTEIARPKDELVYFN